MTVLISGKTVRRELGAQYRGRPLIVEVGPHVLTFRLKGKRSRFQISAVACFERAVAIEAAHIAKRRKEERIARRKARQAGL